MFLSDRLSDLLSPSTLNAITLSRRAHLIRTPIIIPNVYGSRNSGWSDFNLGMEIERGGQKLYASMRLWELPDQYVIEPTDGVTGNILTVSRADGSMKLMSFHIAALSGSQRFRLYMVLWGSSSSWKANFINSNSISAVFKNCKGSYLFVITERQNVGSYLGHPIFRVSSMKILPCDLSLSSTPAEHKKMENEFSALLNAAESTTGLFFSYGANLTLSSQRLHGLGEESKLLPLWRQKTKTNCEVEADPRYMWNNYMMELLIDNKLDPYLLPVVQGSFQHFQTAIGKDIVDVTLIARRCTRRTGTRMWTRGADPDGYVANFVETEQIIQFKGFTASFVQVRGSMPFLWEQIVDLSYKPKFQIVKPEEAPRVAERHFLDLRKRYGAVIAADLVNKHGAEGRLSEMYGKAMDHSIGDDIRYVHFDFHKICGHIHFERLSILYEQIEDFLKKNGYFLLNDHGKKLEEQHGVVRTNCIDCLDRTNVTQSMIGRKMLESQLRRICVFDANETISSHPNFDEKFKIMWANHGDDISIQYSGTPALKGDFVRCGQRTMQGIVNDGCNALARYYLNNFCDGTKQDAMDLLHGHFIASVSRDMSPQPQKSGLEALTMKSLPVALSLALAGFFFALMSLRQVRYDLRHVLLSIMWATLSVAITLYVRANGRIFCNRPRLHKRRF
ncbi:hypothetical protein V2J09_016406 [Rumex salicifolius]